MMHCCTSTKFEFTFPGEWCSQKKIAQINNQDNCNQMTLLLKCTVLSIFSLFLLFFPYFVATTSCHFLSLSLPPSLPPSHTHAQSLSRPPFSFFLFLPLSFSFSFSLSLPVTFLLSSLIHFRSATPRLLEKGEEICVSPNLFCIFPYTL